MNRRRFVVTAISAAAVGGAIVAESCSSTVNPSGTSPVTPIGPNTVTLNVVYATTTIKGYTLRTRTYNGRTTGPTIETRVGETLSIRIVNRLPKEKKASLPSSAEVPVAQTMMEAMHPEHLPVERSTSFNTMNNPHGFNVTNLHTHGLQTIPHLFQPVGTSDPAAKMIEIHPGQEHHYSLPIAPDQPSGLYWYHPHKHGSVDVQVSGGMAGLIVIRGPIDEVPEIAAAREIFIVFQTLNVNHSKSDPSVYDLEYVPFQTPANGGYKLSASYTMFTVNGEGVSWIDNNKNVYTPLGVPQFHARPGEVLRLRMLNGTNAFPLLLTLPGFETYQIGFDGINLLEPLKTDMSGTGVTTVSAKDLFSEPVRLAAEANRIELLVRAPETPGTYALGSAASSDVSFQPISAIHLADFVVSGTPVTMAIPAKLPKPVREYPYITDAEIVRKRTLIFREGPDKRLFVGFAFTIDGQLYDETETEIRPKLGTAEEWRLENTSDEVHPFHIHVNSFEIVALNDQVINPPEFWDTFIIPPKANGKNGSMTIRMRFKEWVGKAVIHCHILPHEDNAMMRNFLIT
jgi:FtsP/CotA-like multicopper oxidase with cupredoxin domain